MFYDIWFDYNFIINNNYSNSNTVNKLLKEVLGYDDSNIRYIQKDKVCIAQSVTPNQVLNIFYPFYNNNIPLSIYEAGYNGVTGDVIQINYIPGYDSTQIGIPQKDHYYDKPVIIDEQIPKFYQQDYVKQLQMRSQQRLQIKEQYISSKPKCPTCNSTNIQKISTTKRMVSIGVFGLASGSIGKTMECKQCGYKW